MANKKKLQACKVVQPADQGPAVTGDTVGGRIRHLRTTRGWTLDQLAAKSGLTKGAVAMPETDGWVGIDLDVRYAVFLSQVENNKTRPGGRVLVQLSRALGASVDYILRGEEVAAATVTDSEVLNITIAKEG